MRSTFLIVFAVFLSTCVSNLLAQDCKVKLPALDGSYIGKCKDGFADGKGEAIGKQRYTGIFKEGMPNGKGIFYYGDSSYHTGSFLAGLKEGKGETHFVKSGRPDSIITGYWSGNIHMGDRYITHTAQGGSEWDRFEVIPSPASGNILTIEISTTTGAPNGGPVSVGNSGYVITIDDIYSDVTFRQLSTFSSFSKSTVSYQLQAYPAKVNFRLSNGTAIQLNLYKNANWVVKLYKNI